MTETTVTKTCTKCKETKSTEDFYRHGDKRLKSCCKPCYNERAKHYSRGNRKAVYQKYAASPKGKACKKRYVASNTYKITIKRYYAGDKGKASRKRRQRTQEQNHPDRTRARRRVTMAVYRGSMPSAKTLRCVSCAKPAKEYHHYLGYAPEHWYNVIPLCLLCHRLTH